MDALTFVTELVKALAWPGTTIVLVLSLRKPLVSLISLLQKLKYKDLELEFGRRVEEITVEATTALPSPPGPTVAPQLPEKYYTLAEAAPRSVVTEAWREVEEAAREAVRRSKLSLSPREMQSPILLVQSLKLAGIIEPQTASLMHDLRGLRNSAAHAPDFVLDRDAVLKYAAVATRIVQRLGDVRPLG